jgi:hypothetical protein
VNRSNPKVTVSAGDVALEVVGRAALIIWFVANNARRINEMVVGRFTTFFAHGKTGAEIVESIESIRVEL